MARLSAAHGPGRTVCRQWGYCERHLLVDDGCSMFRGSLAWWGHSLTHQNCQGAAQGPCAPLCVSDSSPNGQGGCVICALPLRAALLSEKLWPLGLRWGAGLLPER